MAAVSAYQQGREAYAKGVKRKNNPFHYHHPDHELWDEGWVEASQDSNHPEEL